MKKYLNKKNVVLLIRLIFGGLLISGGVSHFIDDPIATHQNEFITALAHTAQMWRIIGAIMVVTGTAIISGFMLPLALIIQTPISIGIFLFHLSEVGKVVPKGQEGGIVIGTIVLALQAALVWLYIDHYKSLLKPARVK
jgi:uncharacterized membrane protein YphA (DoxX/SURF4 family)